MNNKPIREPINYNHLHPHFIGLWQMPQAKLCDDIIEFFETQPDLQTNGMAGFKVDTDIKKSVDISIYPRDLTKPNYQVIKTYIDFLFACYQDYSDQWDFIEIFPKLEIGTFNIQRYGIGGHFKRVHSERLNLESAHRVFAWMTYLNDVDDGGGTHFTHYDLTLQPQKGRTLIWPAEWTHAHYGDVVKTNYKYVITGWMHFSV
jgi:hypothetical protein